MPLTCARAWWSSWSKIVAVSSSATPSPRSRRYHSCAASVAVSCTTPCHVARRCAAGPPAARCPAPRSPRRPRASPRSAHRRRWRAGRPSGAPPSRAPSGAARSPPSSAAAPSSTPAPPGRAPSKRVDQPVVPLLPELERAHARRAAPAARGGPAARSSRREPTNDAPSGRCPARCRVRSSTVQPGQDSTGVSGGASATAAAKAGPSARSAPIQKSLRAVQSAHRHPPGGAAPPVGAAATPQPRVKGVSDVYAQPTTEADRADPGSTGAATPRCGSAAPAEADVRPPAAPTSSSRRSGSAARRAGRWSWPAAATW